MVPTEITPAPAKRAYLPADLPLNDPRFPHGSEKGWKRGCRPPEACPGDGDGQTCEAAHQAGFKRPPNPASSAPELAVDDVADEVLEPVDQADVAEEHTAAEPDEDPAPPAPAVPRPPTPDTAGRTSSIGSSRRLRGLVFMGYTPVELAQATQISVDNIWWLLIAPPATVQDITHRIIRERFLRLREQPRTAHDGTPAYRDIQRSRELAADQDWKSPYGWDDIDVADSTTHYGKPGQGVSSTTRDAAVQKLARLQEKYDALEAAFQAQFEGREELDAALSAAQTSSGTDSTAHEAVEPAPPGGEVPDAGTPAVPLEHHPDDVAEIARLQHEADETVAQITELSEQLAAAHARTEEVLDEHKDLLQRDAIAIATPRPDPTGGGYRRRAAGDHDRPDRIRRRSYRHGPARPRLRQHPDHPRRPARVRDARARRPRDLRGAVTP